MSDATFRISSETLSPSEITAALGLQPSRTFDRGSLLSVRNPKSARRSKSLWHLDSGLPDSAPLSAHIQKLVSLLQPLQEQLDHLGKSCSLDVFCGLSPEEGDMLEVDAGLLQKLARLSCDFIVDFLRAEDH